MDAQTDTTGVSTRQRGMELILSLKQKMLHISVGVIRCEADILGWLSKDAQIFLM